MVSIGRSPSCACMHRLMRRGVPEDVRVERERDRDRERERIVERERERQSARRTRTILSTSKFPVCQPAKHTYERSEGKEMLRGDGIWPLNCYQIILSSEFANRLERQHVVRARRLQLFNTAFRTRDSKDKHGPHTEIETSVPSSSIFIYINVYPNCIASFERA